MRSTLLAIGDLYLDDVKKAPSINKFVRYRNILIRKKIQFELASSDDVLLQRLPNVATKRLNIMLFFPYNYWNNIIERYDRDDRIYGDEHFGKDFKKLFLRIDRILKDYYKGKDIRFVNSPLSCILDRNKLASGRLLRNNDIAMPRIYNVKNTGQLERILDKKAAGALFIKPVFGSMGKGITIVTKKDCFTNFIFRSNKIISRLYDYNWEFRRVSAKRRNDFLNILIKRNFLFEEAVELPVAGKRRFDIRVHVIYGRIPYLFARSIPMRGFITNWSQGGRVEGAGFLKRFVPRRKMDEIKSIARKAAKIAGLNYAGVDVILDKNLDKIFVLEIHSFPGYARRFNLMKFLSERIT